MTIDKMIEILKPYKNSMFGDPKYGEVSVAEIIEALKEQKEGKWIMKSDGFIFRQEWGVCSNCGNTLDFAGLNAGRGNGNFCPNCGAKMDIEHE